MKPATRSRARRLAMQGLYEWQMSGNQVERIAAQYVVEKDMRNLDEAYFRELLTQAVAHAAEMDQQIAAHIDRKYEEIDPVEKAILRLGAYELAHRLDIPYKVVINEAVELAKTFGADQSHKFINGVMDKLAAELRKVEVIAHKQRQ